MADSGSHSEAVMGRRISALKAWVCVLITLAVGALHFLKFDPLVRAENYAHDFLVRFGPAHPGDPRLVFLPIDRREFDLVLPADSASDPFFQGMIRWPWRRDVHARLLERILSAGARLVVLDILFLSPSGQDEALQAILSRHRDRIVVGALWEEQVEENRRTETIRLPAPVAGDLASVDPARRDAIAGIVNFWPDRDGVIRRVDLVRSTESGPAIALSGRALQKLGIPVSAGRPPVRLNFPRPPTDDYPTFPAYKVLLPDAWERDLKKGAVLKDKIVVIGPSGTWSKDEARGPFRLPLPGVKLHLAAMHTVLGHLAIEGPSAWFEFCILGAAGLLAFLMGLSPRSVGFRFLSVAGILILYGGVLFTLQELARFSAPAVAPVAAFFGGSLFCIGIDLAASRRERNRIRSMFSTMVSPDVLAYMQEDPTRFRLAGERKMATIFFSDLAGFTGISEKLAPDQLASLLNSYLTPMSEIVIRHGGYIDKYEGDAIMADFGVPVWNDTSDSHAWKACWSALEQLEALPQVQKIALERYGSAIDLRIGINTGEVSAGNMGSAQKFQYTVMGDTVNTAARLEPANKLFGTRILVGEATWTLARNQVEGRRVGNLKLKGKTDPLPCYEILAKKGELPPRRAAAVAFFEAGLKAYESRNFPGAVAEFEKALAACLDDGPSAVYLKLCRELIASPPDDAWIPAWTQESK